MTENLRGKSDGYTDVMVEVNDEGIALLLAEGHITSEPDGAYRLTDVGAAWLNEWFRERLARRPS